MPDLPKKNKKGPSTQQFIPIKEVKEGTVIMKDGSLRAVIMVSSINFSLKNEDEKNAIVYSYQDFLNSLSFPVQILIRSKKLVLDKYIADLKKQEEAHTNELLKLQTSQYIDFINELLEYANIMEKRFFVVVPYYPGGLEKSGGMLKNFFNPKTTSHETSTFETNRMELTQRVDQVMSSLGSVGLRCVALNTEDLLELYYTVYNPDTANEEKLRNPESLESPIISGGLNAR